MKNVNELRDELGETFDGLVSGSVHPKVAKEIANVAGKMINSAKVQLDYHALRQEKKTKITFLHSTDT
jgi:hypothetical protein|tara:strand:- start:475 stop:678 length:204 start_codon:yes stop_codon:yes gene_type:complete